MQSFEPDEDSLLGDYYAVCNYCGTGAKVRLELGKGLVVGDVVYLDPTRENGEFGRCRKCKRELTMIITEAPPEPLPPEPQGFWRIPTE